MREGVREEETVRDAWTGGELAPGGLVRAIPNNGCIEVAFRYSHIDVAAIKSIPGRRWDAQRRVWTVPDRREVVQALKAAFGARLVMGQSTSIVEPDPSRGRSLGPLRHSSDASDESIVGATTLHLRTRAYSAKTERAYLGWIRHYLAFRNDRCRSGDSVHATVRAFLEHLAVHRGLAAKTRNQAASALAFLMRDVFGEEQQLDIPRAKGPPHLPTVLCHRDVLAVLRQLNGTQALVVSLLYSGGLRIEECLRIRVKDVDFELRQILVRDGKGKKDRYVPLANRLVETLRVQVERIREIHARDRSRGQGWAPLPGALHRKDPHAGHELAWQFVFPSRKPGPDPATGRVGRWHMHPSAVRREVKRAARRSGIEKRVSCHTFRHSFATEALRGGCDIRTLQHVMGHKDVRTTMIYLHVVEQSGLYIRSPLDRPGDPEEPGPSAGVFSPLSRLANPAALPPLTRAAAAPTTTAPPSQANSSADKPERG